MKNRVLVVAPHADDETLGCGGTLLRHIAEGDEVHWLLITSMSRESGFSESQIIKRDSEVEQVAKMYGVKSVIQLRFPPASLDTVPKGQVIDKVSKVMRELEPEVIYTPYRNDAHSDHEVVYDVVTACSKSFRYPFIKRVLAYETISETDYGMKPEDGGFRPNVFVDVSDYLITKLEILNIFESEMGKFPFPRSNKAIESLAYVRGAQSHQLASEAFMLIKEVI
jgi:LmbE family N-acetylglucosaminyl deacetylase